MSKIYYKATKVDGTDFYAGTVDYAGALTSGKPLKRLTSEDGEYRTCSDTVYHAADTPSETLIGGSWPCRLFEVTGKPVATEGHKFGFRSLRVVRELPAHLALGPNGEAVAALLEELATFTPVQWAAAWGAARGVARDAARDTAWEAAHSASRDAARGAGWGVAREAAWDAAWGAARGVARDAGWDAAWGAARGVAREAGWGAAWGAARGAARGAAAMTVRDLIEEREFDILFAPIKAAREAA